MGTQNICKNNINNLNRRTTVPAFNRSGLKTFNMVEGQADTFDMGIAPNK